MRLDRLQSESPELLHYTAGGQLCWNQCEFSFEAGPPRPFKASTIDDCDKPRLCMDPWQADPDIEKLARLATLNLLSFMDAEQTGMEAQSSLVERVQFQDDRFAEV